MRAQEKKLSREELEHVTAGRRARSTGGREVLDGGTRKAPRFRVTDVEGIDNPHRGLTPGGKST